MVSTMLQDTQSRIALVLIKAALEMSLIGLLLLNGLFSYFISKFADYFRLKPPCIWCSRIDHIFEPRKLDSSSRVLFCENHAIEISKLGYCPDHENLSEREGMCGDCSSFCKKTEYELGFVGCSCCGANLGELGFFDCEEEFEDIDGIRGKPIVDLIVDDSPADASKELGFSDCEVESGEEIEKLRSALRAERKALQCLYGELEEERSASAVAANQTMAMINRLQEEKAALEMEALHYQRMMDEQAEYDHEALELLNELLRKREKEKVELKRELEIYRSNSKSLVCGDELMKMKECSCDSTDDSGSLEEERVYALSSDDNFTDHIIF